MRQKRKLIIVIMALAMSLCMAFGLFMAKADMVVLQSGPATASWDAVAFDANVDANGIVLGDIGSVGVVDWNATPKYTSKAIGTYGMKDGSYSYEEDGSNFTLEANKFILFGPNTEVELDRVINITFTIDNSASGLGQLGFAMHGDREKALLNETNAWNMGGLSTADLFISVWPASSNSANDVGVGDARRGKVIVYTASNTGGVSSSNDVTVDTVNNISIYIDKDGASYVDFNGVRVADLGISSSSFTTTAGKATDHATLGFYSFHKETSVKMHLSQKENANVSFASATSGFSAPEQFVYAGQSVSLPTPSTIAGKTFEGWYLDEGCTKKYDNRAVYGDTTIYAKYLDDNASNNLTVTFKSKTGGFADKTTVIDSGSSLNVSSDMFDKVGYTTTWEYENGNAYSGEAITSNTTLYAVWTEEAVLLNKKAFGSVSAKTESPTADGNGFDMLRTDRENGEIYVDAITGESITDNYYGSAGEDVVDKGWYSNYKNYASGSMVNTIKLDVTKEIIIKFNLQNWNYNFVNDNISKGLAQDARATFQLFDGLKSAMMAGCDVERGGKGELVAITTSTLNKVDRYGENYYGVFHDIKADVSSNKWYGYDASYGTGELEYNATDARNQWYTLKIYISPDGTGNYLHIEHSRTDASGANDTVVTAMTAVDYGSKLALNGVKQSDFVNGYAYLQIANLGCTQAYGIYVSQCAPFKKVASENGSYTVQYVNQSENPASGSQRSYATINDGETKKVFYNSKVKLTITPDDGYAVDKVKFGENFVSVPSTGGEVEFLSKSLEGGTIEVTFAKPATVSWDLNGAGKPSTAPDDIITTVGSYIPAYSGITPSKRGDSFVGWYHKETNTPWDFETDTVAGDMTLIVKWASEVTAVTYTVTFDSDGGNYTPSTQNVNENETATAPTTAPTKDGWTFKYWAKSGTTTEFDFSTAITEDITLVAIYQQDVVTYTVTFDSNGGTTVAPQTVEEGGKATAPTSIKPGYTFDGWYLAGATTSFDFNTAITQNITLIAKWVEGGSSDVDVWTVSFNSNGGTDVDSQIILSGEKAVKPQDPTNGSYTFLGWYLGEQAFDFNTPITQSITLTARWSSIVLITVNFDSNGGTAVDSLLILSGDYAWDPYPSPTKAGYTFLGWYLDGELFDFANNPITEEITLVAKWRDPNASVEDEKEEKPQTGFYITFNTDGGSEVEGQRVGYYGVIERPEDPTKDGYYFVGWYLNGVEYKFNTAVICNVELDAVWTTEAPETEKETKGGCGSSITGAVAFGAVATLAGGCIMVAKRKKED